MVEQIVTVGPVQESPDGIKFVDVTGPSDDRDEYDADDAGVPVKLV
jgi:hypothetical protein